MTKRAVLYARVSRDDRDADGRSLTSQLRMCREHAEERGHRVVAELAEDERGVSGAQLDTPQLGRVYSLAENDAVDVLVCREMDRLARDLAKQLIVEKRLESLGVQIEYVLGEYPDTPEGSLMKNVRAVIAEYERLKIVERTTRGIREVVRAGNVWTAGHSPYGYREAEVGEKRTLVIEEDEARWVRRMFEWYCHGDGEHARLSIRAVADKLQALGVPSPADKRSDVWQHKDRPRCHWATTTVRSILKNEVYVGRWIFTPSEGEPIVVEVSPMIEESVFRLAQRRLRENLRMARRNVKYDYLMRGRLFCKCGYRMHGRQNRRKYFYYRCPATSRKDLALECDASTLNVKRLDAAVWEKIKAELSDLDRLRRRWERFRTDGELATAPERERLERLDAQVEEGKRRLERLVDLALDGEFSREVFSRRRDEIEERLSSLRSERERLLASIDEPEDRDVGTLLEYAAEIRARLDDLEGHDERRWVIDTLDIQGRLIGEKRVALTLHGVPVGEVKG